LASDIFSIKNNIYFVRSVFLAGKINKNPNPCKDVIDAKFIPVNEILKMKDRQLVRAGVLKKIIKDYKRGVQYNLKLLSEF